MKAIKPAGIPPNLSGEPSEKALAKSEASAKSEAIPELEPLDGSASADITVGPDKIVVKDRFTIEKVGDLWLLRSLGQRELVVNDVTTVASFLEGGETIVSSDLRYRFQLTGDRGVSKEGRSVQASWLELLLLGLAAAGFILLQFQPSSRNPVVVNPELTANPSAPIKLSADPAQAQIEARLILEQCRFYLREYEANDDYLRQAIQDLDYLQSELPKLGAPQDFRQEVAQTLARAKQTLQSETKRLRDNAIIAHAAGRSQQYIEILHKIARLIQDPSDPVYRWAVMRAQAAGS